VATEDDDSSWTSSKRSQILIVLLATAIANQYGFWRIFHIAILEHIGITDMPRLAVWPLISALYSIVIGTVFGAAVQPPRKAGAKLPDPNPLARLVLKHRFWIGVVLIVIGYLAAVFAEPRFAAGVAPSLLSLGLAASVTRDVQIPEIKTVVTPSVLFWTVFVLGIAYGNGVVTAMDIRDGRSYLAATFPNQPQDPLRYLARVGDHVFFYNPTKRAASLYELKDVEPLTLTPVSDQVATATPSKSK
jgi:hypothetical protein